MWEYAFGYLNCTMTTTRLVSISFKFQMKQKWVQHGIFVLYFALESNITGINGRLCYVALPET